MVRDRPSEFFGGNLSQSSGGPWATTPQQRGLGPRLWLEEERQGFAVKPCKSVQIDRIDAALAQFALGDKGLRPPERLRHLNLR